MKEKAAVLKYLAPCAPLVSAQPEPVGRPAIGAATPRSDNRYAEGAGGDGGSAG